MGSGGPFEGRFKGNVAGILHARTGTDIFTLRIQPFQIR